MPRLTHRGWGTFALALAVFVVGPSAARAATPPRVLTVLAGADLPDPDGPAAYPGGVAFAAVADSAAAGARTVGNSRGATRVLEHRAIGPGVTAWVWDGRDARGAAARAGDWRLWCDTPLGPRAVRLIRPACPEGATPRVTFTLGAVGGR
jgi:hypothetical protein